MQADKVQQELHQKTFVCDVLQGVHARIATLIVLEAQKFSGDCQLLFEDQEANCKSLIEVLSLGIPFQGVFFLRGKGSLDAFQAIAKVVNSFSKEVKKEG